MSMASDARFWDKASRRYSRSRISDMDACERTLDRTRAILGADDRVLELGCGTGTTALRLADGVRSYLATDISSEMISIAKEKHAAETVQTLVFRTPTAESLGPDEAGFNAAPGFNYLHLVRDVPETLRRIHSVLAPGGVFVSKTPCLGDMNLLIRSLAARIARHGQGTACHHLPRGGRDQADDRGRLRYCHDGTSWEQAHRYASLHRGTQGGTRSLIRRNRAAVLKVRSEAHTCR